MKIILFILLLTNSIGCSGEIKQEKTPVIKRKASENPSTNSPNPQTNITQEHISGNGENHISGGPPSSHISGQ
tara:strand:+ start:467 stop:685 length:219 start_codon:yes stop_codon:yes gene_type:complete